MGIGANARRVAHLARVLMRHGVAHWADRRLPRWLGRRLSDGLDGPGRLRTVLERMGGTFVKFGQMLALQPDLVPLDYCDALADLLDRVPPFGMDQVETTFQEEFGKTTGEIFEAFDPRPLATASIGQVHVAVLEGRRVAVKVRRPDVEREFGGDIRLMSAAVGLIESLGLRRLRWMVEPMTEFMTWTREELDFRCEARYAEQLRRNARGNLAERVPLIEWRYVSRRTLVMEFFDGVTVLDYVRARSRGDGRVLGRLAEMGFVPDTFARNVIENFLGDAFRHGLFHADLHPANLMILSGSVVGYVDFGIVGVLSAYSRRHLLAMTLAYTRGDLDGMCDAFFRVSAFSPSGDPEAFRSGLRRLGDDWYETRGRQRRLRKNFTLVMLDMLRLSRATGVWPERDVIKYIRSAIAIDGLIARAAPAFDVGAYLEWVCGRLTKWQAWAGVVSGDTLLGSVLAGGRLLQDGLLRGAALLRQLSEVPLREKEATPSTAGAFRRAAVFVGACIVLVLIRPSIGSGGNLVVAGALLVGAAFLLLGRGVRRPARDRA